MEDLTEPESVVNRVVSLQTSPANLPPGGGDVEVTATVTLGGQPESGVEIVFDATAGSWVPDNHATTDGDGRATRTLQTDRPASITAKVRAGGVTVASSTEVALPVGGQAASGVQFEIATDPAQPVVGKRTDLSITARQKEDGSRVSGQLEVDFGDGQAKRVGDFEGETVVGHTWESASLFDIGFELIEEDGTLSTGLLQVEVVDDGATRVILSANTDQTPAREPVVFKIRPEDDNGKVAAGEVRIDWGDDRSTKLGEIDEVVQIEHSFREPGSYRVLAELTDPSGQQARASYRVRVTERLTVSGELSANDTTPFVDETVDFTFTARLSDGSNAAGEARVNFADGTDTTVSVNGSRDFSHTFLAPGNYDVSVDFEGDEGRTARTTLLIVVASDNGGGGGGGDGGGGGGGGGADAISPSSVTWLHANVSSWSVTSTVTNVSISDAQICINHSKAGGWPVVSGVEGNPWVIAQVNGRWYGGTYEWVRPGQICKTLGAQPPRTTTRTVIGPHVKASPLSSWVPKSGEVVYFFVSTPGRAGVSTINERSNIVKVVWP